MEELRAYLKEVGAEISVERSPKGLEDDLHKIIGVCDTCFSSEATEVEVEALLNSIVSVLIVVSGSSLVQVFSLFICFWLIISFVYCQFSMTWKYLDESEIGLNSWMFLLIFPSCKTL